jgi:hypothetical protein
MPSAAGYTWTDTLDGTIRRCAASAGVPLAWAYTFIASESGFNPDARNESAIEHSYGLLQLNADGGQGTGYPVETLLDPEANLRIGLPYVARALAQTNEPNADLHRLVWLVSIRSGHPGPVRIDDPRILTILSNFTAFIAAYPEPFPAPPPTPSLPPAGSMPSNTAIKGLVAATYILSVGHPLSDLSPEDAAALRYVASLV